MQSVERFTFHETAHTWAMWKLYILYNLKGHKWAGGLPRNLAESERRPKMKAEQAVIQRILNLCHERNVTANSLAHLSAVPPSTVKNILYGNSQNTGIVTIAKICNGLDISIGEFFDDALFQTLEQEIE